MILPCLNTNRIYVVHIDALQSSVLQTVITGDQLNALGVSGPHTSHCLPDGHIMVSCMGDENQQAKGSLLLLDGTTFQPIKVWNDQPVSFGYDFWYQPKFDVLVSTEWTSPRSYKSGFDMTNKYGTCIHFWQYSTGKLVQTIDLKSIVEDTSMPLEVRFMHNPVRSEGYVGCAASSNVFRFYLDNSVWQAKEVIRIAPKQVTGWMAGELPALITDIIISLDDRFLYVSAWAFGEVRQYNIADHNCSKPCLLDTIRLGGIPTLHPSMDLVHDSEPLDAEKIISQVKGTVLNGGAQMLQLSLDGQRLYVTNSLYSAWDKQFYPKLYQSGAQLIKLDVDTKKGGLYLDSTFLVDFGKEPNGPALAHEMRYPGGDCTSDIWLAE